MTGSGRSQPHHGFGAPAIQQIFPVVFVLHMCVPRMFLASREKKRADSLLVASFFSAALRFFFRAAALFFLARVLRADEAFCFDDGTFRRRRLPVEVSLSASIFGCI